MAFLVTFVALSIIVFIHELGHMLLAKRAGVGVLEFSIGMGPVIFKRFKGETQYSIRAFPLGGFVKLAGMDDTDEPVSDELNYHKKSIPSRLAVISAGAIFNIVLGFLIFFFMFIFIGSVNYTTKIESVLSDSAAQQSGIHAGDRILAIDGDVVKDDYTKIFSKVKASEGQLLYIKVKRDESELMLGVIPQLNEKEQYKIGVVFASERVRYMPHVAVYKGIQATGAVVKNVFTGLSMIISGKVSYKELSGPVGIIQMASFGFNQSVADFLNIMALISISLGVFNLFPLPVLDGGHIVFLLIEAVRGKPVSDKIQNVVNNLGVAFLISMMLFVVVNDVISWNDRMLIFKEIFS